MADLLGFVGVGRMGGPMASRLLDAGYRLCVYDVSDEATRPLVARGAELAASPAEVASMAETVFMSLPTPDVVRELRWAATAG
jgi:3-hydroxyisobutyrate dehydrogenase-like beta-hydroxyacid dehydrogenase